MFAEKLLYFSIGALATAISGFFGHTVLFAATAISSILILYLLWRRKSMEHSPKVNNEIVKIRKKREKIASDKHRHINEQIEYIEIEWGYSKEQKRTIERFLKQRAYTQVYNKLTASLLPQLINLVDQCNDRGRSGCKREVSRRIRELTALMKDELRREKTKSTESFETSLEVFDRLLGEK